MDLDLKTTSVGATPIWLDTTEGLRFLVGGVTLDSAAVAADGNGDKIVQSGTPVQKNGTKWEPSGDVAADAPTAILWQTVNLRDGDKHASAIDHARVREPALPIALHADGKASLQTVGITFRS